MGSLKNKVAIVTGSGTGIGQACALMFADEGATLVLVGRRREPLEKTASDCESRGSSVLVLPTDLEDGDAAEKVVLQTIQHFGRVDILINNAAFRRGEDRVPILDLSEELFQRVMDIKVTGTFLCTKAVVKHMIDQGDGGKIVNISSTAGKTGAPNFLAYNGANFAIVGMTQSMARELGPQGIHVAHFIIDGAIDTPFIKENFPDTYALKEKDGILQPKEIAEAYWNIHVQHPSAWTQEMDLRPYMEKF